jgi:hypothetical protein
MARNGAAPPWGSSLLRHAGRRSTTSSGSLMSASQRHQAHHGHRQGRHQDVVVLDVAQLVGEHAFELDAVHLVEQPGGDRDGGVLAGCARWRRRWAPRRRSCRSGLRQARCDAQALDQVVQPRVGARVGGLDGAAHASGRSRRTSSRPAKAEPMPPPTAMPTMNRCRLRPVRYGARRHSTTVVKITNTDDEHRRATLVLGYLSRTRRGAALPAGQNSHVDDGPAGLAAGLEVLALAELEHRRAIDDRRQRSGSWCCSSFTVSL